MIDEKSVGLANSKSEWGAGSLVRLQIGKPGQKPTKTSQHRQQGPEMRPTQPTQLVNQSQSTPDPAVRRLRSQSRPHTNKEGQPGDP